ncbi:hypothetical protein QYE76_035095 [Lolium multiflorum]|uniref:DUF7597 domain-containing protein n=1 Tax=Lolium multiflorum TaxID=4521 RepID=A0AAD8QZC3_LOLMU|nr:hypothetical protein QYE76_035095 [Lolium multiflorum]
MNSKGTPIVGKYLQAGDTVDIGSEIEFSTFHVKVIRCVLSPKEDLIASDQDLLNMMVSDPRSADRCWKVTYSTHVDLARGRMKAYDGSLMLSVKDNWMLLKNAKGAMIGRGGLKSSDALSIGAKICFPNHVIRLGRPLLPQVIPVNSQDELSQVVSACTEVRVSTVIEEPPKADSQSSKDSTPFAESVHAALFRGLSFSHGINFAKDVKSKFNSEVHPSSHTAHFLMVVAFGRANFQMEEDLVSIALEAAIGGSCGYKPPNPPVTTFEKGECSTSSAMGNDLEKNLQPSVDSLEEGQKDFENMIDDMAFKVWKCGRCLSLKHESKDCSLSSPRETHTSTAAPPPPASSASAMAVFEVDPTPWLPWGHQIIDGGPTRLPRTYYNASQDPPPQHRSFCVAMVDPPPPPHAAAHWRHQVNEFLVGLLQRNVLTVQPSLFGVALFEMSSPNSASALVQHGQFQLHNRSLRFLHVDETQNHRAILGCRRGWLMFLGVNPDYRNDLDIANAVATFGQFHYWNSNDPVKDRVLVYATFTSPQLVPRDVVFGKYASVGGIKETWTAPVYVLTADFADALPADEDPMPPNGNPHALPGNLMPNMNFFLLTLNIQKWVGMQCKIHLNEVQGQQEELPVSMVLNISDGSDSSVNMFLDGVAPVQKNLQVFAMVEMFIGPSPPPEMLRHRWLAAVLPTATPVLQFSKLGSSPFIFLKHDAVMLGKDGCLSTYQGHDGENKECRRFTRSCLNKEGYRPRPVLDIQPKIKKKSRANLLLVRAAENDEEEQHNLHNEDTREEETDEATADIPVTPLPVLQFVGIALGIAPEKLTREQLEAEPVKGNPKQADNV